MTKLELRTKALELKRTEPYARELANALLDLIGEYTAEAAEAAAIIEADAREKWQTSPGA